MPWNPEDWDAWIDTESVESGRPAPHLAHVQHILQQLPDRERKTVGDLGRRGIRRLPFLESLFHRVLLVDTDETRKPACRPAEPGVVRCSLRDLELLRVRLDVTIAVDAIGGSGGIDRTLSLVHGALVEGGLLIATFPAAPRGEAPFTMRLGPWEWGSDAQLHEMELQYRLQRAGFQGVRVLRVAGGVDNRASLLCMAVRRAWN